MDLVNPDGSRIPIGEEKGAGPEEGEQKEVEQGKETPGDTAKPEEKKTLFSCNIGADGVMRIEAHLPACVGSDEALYLFRGFMDAKRDEAITSIIGARSAIAKEKAGIIKASNHKGFMNFLRGRR